MDNYFNLQKFASNGLQKEAIFGLFSPNAQKLYLEFKQKTYALSFDVLVNWQTKIDRLAQQEKLDEYTVAGKFNPEQFADKFEHKYAQRKFLNRVQDDLVFGLDKDVKYSLAASKQLLKMLQKLENTRSADNSAYVQFYELLKNDQSTIERFKRQFANSQNIVNPYSATESIDKYVGSKFPTEKLYKHIQDIIHEAGMLGYYGSECNELVQKGLNTANSDDPAHTARLQHDKDEYAAKARKGRVTDFEPY